MVLTLDKNIKAEIQNMPAELHGSIVKLRLWKKWKQRVVGKYYLWSIFFFVESSHLFCISKDNINYIFWVTFSGAQGNIKEIGQRLWGISQFPTSNLNLWKSTICKLFCIKCQIIKSDFFWMSESQITIGLCKLF